MRNKIDYGIDLGTTNSSIARMQKGEPVIIKSGKGMDTMPSCVSFTPKKDILVGVQAVDALKNDNIRVLRNFEESESNTFLEFKRTMGTTVTYHSSYMGREFTSEELSAEVLKKLKSFITDENISSIVITVPAKFLNPQNEATMKAAKLAGFKQIRLLQEPVAAAIAYGMTSKVKDGYFLVFDFGGGTFDAALLKAEEGVFSVKDTEGNDRLGGKNIDEAIVDQIIIPYLRENYAIESIIADTKKLELLRNALEQPFAEEAKIELSFKPTSPIASIEPLPFKDENGKEPEIYITVGQKELESVVTPFFQKAIDITKSLLERNHLKGADLTALILVGGPTHSPILRRMLREQVTEKVDSTIDPMTIVAKGAALFASTVEIVEDIKEASRDKTKLQLELKYESTTVDSQELINVKLLPDKTEGSIPEKVFVDIVRKPEGFSTGKKQITEKATLLELILVENCYNEFEIIAYNNSGNRVECEPNRFTILHGVGGVDSMQVLPYHIGIVKYFPEEEKDLFYHVKGLEKNKSIKSGIVGDADNLKTRSDIRPGIKGDIIRIPIYQGAYNADGTNPDLNYHIIDVIISGEDIPKFLPAGSPVNIRIKVDASSLMTFTAEFPTIEYEHEETIEMKQAEPPTPEELRKRFEEAISVSKRVNCNDLKEKLEKLDEDIESIGTTAEGRLRLMNEYRTILIELDKADRGSRWPEVEKNLKDSFYELEDLIEKIRIHRLEDKVNMEKACALVEDFREKINNIIHEKNIKEAKALAEEILRFDFRLRNAVTDNALDAQVLKDINDNFDSYHWKNPMKAKQLVNQGMQMVVDGNIQAIRPILVELFGLMPEHERPQTLV